MDRKNNGIVFATIAIILLGLGIFSTDWWHRTDTGQRSFSMGLDSVEVCNSEECLTVTLNYALQGEYGAFQTLGAIIRYGGVLAGILLLIALIIALRQKRYEGRIGPAPTALLVCSLMLLCVLLHTAIVPGRAEFSVGIGLLMYMPGTVLGIIGAVYLAMKEPAPATDAERIPSGTGQDNSSD